MTPRGTHASVIRKNWPWPAASGQSADAAAAIGATANDRLRDVHVADSVRTPAGKYGGALAPARPDDLAAPVVRALPDRTPALDPARVDDVDFGNANGAGEENRMVCRMAVPPSGLLFSVAGSTVNRLCASVVTRGGTVAIGHPLGASGARLAGAVAHQLAAGSAWRPCASAAARARP